MTWKSPNGVRIRAFRPAHFIQATFQCLYVTGDNISTLKASCENNPNAHRQMARQVLAALRDVPIKTTERVLAQMESEWTGTPRASIRFGPSRTVFAGVAFETWLSGAWELKKR